MSTRRRPDWFGLLALASFGATAADRQSLDDAWWTGPILAAGAATLPQGRVLVEPYVFDYRTRTYLLYGVTDKLTAGLIPVVGFNDAGDRSSKLQLGDLTVQAQYRLSQFREGGWLPTTSLVVQQSLSAYTTTVALRSRYYSWMPNGRIMRTRFHVSYGRLGVIVGARSFVAGRNTNATLTPMLAINMLF